jgi:hypothetical protein
MENFAARVLEEETRSTWRKPVSTNTLYYPHFESVLETKIYSY